MNWFGWVLFAAFELVVLYGWVKGDLPTWLAVLALVLAIAYVAIEVIADCIEQQHGVDRD